MLPFIDEENYKMHLEYVNLLRVRLSAFRKMRGDNDSGKSAIAKREVYVANEVLLHEAYFNSFSEREFPRSACATRVFGSGNELLMALYRCAMDAVYGFVGVARGAREGMYVFSCCDYFDMKPKLEPILAVDVCEHAYFGDFGFDKERYVKRALAHLSLDRLDEFS